MTTALVIHGHFYQPPRENPWTELVDREHGRGALPRLERAHQRRVLPPQRASRASATPTGRVERIVNNYASSSFNFGPTLLNWLERSSPDTYARIVEADRESARRARRPRQRDRARLQPRDPPALRRARPPHAGALGARRLPHSLRARGRIALAPRDRLRRRDARSAHRRGLALRHPLAVSGRRECAPLGAGEHAGRRFPAATVDTTVPYSLLPPRRRRALHRGLLLRRAGRARHRLRGAARVEPAGSSRACARAARRGAALVNVATDGESYGHHFRFGDRCIAYALDSRGRAAGLPRHELRRVS